MTSQPSLAALLAAVERWQQPEESTGKPWPDSTFDIVEALIAVDVPAIRQLAYQHAEALRRAMVLVDDVPEALEQLNAAADFLDGKAE